MRKIAVLFLFLLSGCTREAELNTGPEGGNAVLSLTIPGTRGAVAPYDEGSIVSARLIVYHSGTPTGVKKMALNTTDFHETDGEISCRKMIPAGYINVYLIANEAAAGIGTALAAIGESSPESAIDAIRLSYGGLINPSAAGITMFRAHKGLKIMPGDTPDSDGTITYADGGTFDASDFGKVERNATKLNIKLVWDKANTAVWNSSGTPVTFEAATLRSMPKNPWLAVGKGYGLGSDGDYFDVSVSQIDETVSTADRVEAEFTVIVPEHIVSDKDRRTHLEIDCLWGNVPLTYKLALGEGLSTKTNSVMMSGEAALSDYRLLRNTGYTITATIKGKGDSDTENIETQLDISSWTKPGQNVIVDGMHWLTVSGDEFVIPDGGGETTLTAQTNYTITSQGYPAGIVCWTDDDWVMLTLGGTATNRTITIMATPNPSSSLRTAKVKVKAGNMTKVINVRQLPTITGGGTIPANIRTYVGAFWRADQTGERVIKINVGGTNDYTGAWSAYIYWMSDDWNANDIVLAAGSSPDGAIYTASPNDAENYQVGGNATSISGTVAASGSILFRIGLKSTWSSTPDKPARYAVVVLSYKDNTIFQKIFLRQGHEADYLIHPEDDGRDGDYVRKFSPYNLTAPDMTDADDYIDVAINGGTWTAYPSQGGAFFQFAARSEHERRAWHPTRTLAPAGWSTLYTNWSATHETCPSGYRRPTVTDITYATSEFAQSLLTDVMSSAIKNAVWGYLADGFFDRRGIVTSAAGIFYSTVEASSYKAAYRGLLFYNSKEGSERENASLFFPGNGERVSSTSGLSNAGSSGKYWSDTPSSATLGRYLSFNSSSVNPQNSYGRAFGYAVRCVAE